VLASVVRLLEATLIRVGNEEYARENESYGLTTMRNRHVDIEGAKLVFHFRGKSGVNHEVDVRDRRVARIVRRCQELPGHHLFQYLDDDGSRRTVDSDDVNAYLQSITGEEFTAKDFRTWSGTVLAAEALQAFEAFDSETQAKKNIVQAIESVAKKLGNTPRCVENATSTRKSSPRISAARRCIPCAGYWSKRWPNHLPTSGPKKLP
jgi:DNA topoisomerase-1